MTQVIDTTGELNHTHFPPGEEAYMQVNSLCTLIHFIIMNKDG